MGLIVRRPRAWRSDGVPTVVRVPDLPLPLFGARPPLVIGLAKKEELIFLPGDREPIKLGRENPGLKLCQAIRDEAHRFAQHDHHLLVRKRTMPDAGPVKRKSRGSKGGTSPADRSDPSDRSAYGESSSAPEPGA